MTVEVEWLIYRSKIEAESQIKVSDVTKPNTLQGKIWSGVGTANINHRAIGRQVKIPLDLHL